MTFVSSGSGATGIGGVDALKPCLHNPASPLCGGAAPLT
jgi:hypothetical protein